MDVMKNTIITILATLVVCLGGYLVYDKFISNNNSSTTTSKKYSYELVPASSDEIQKINLYQEPWRVVMDNEEFGMTGATGRFINNKTLQLSSINSLNTINFSNSVISYVFLVSGDLCNTLKNCDRINEIFLLDNGAIYFCNDNCNLNAKTEEDMQLLLIDESIEGMMRTNENVFVKTTSGIKKIVYSE